MKIVKVIKCKEKDLMKELEIEKLKEKYNWKEVNYNE